MAWTQNELDALKAAYARGTLRVTYDGKTIEYGSAVDLKSRIDTIQAELSANSPNKRPVAGYAAFSRGNG